VKDAGFRLRPGTYRVTHAKGGPFVTGLHVGGRRPKAPRRLRRRIERFLYFAETFTVTSAAEKTFRHGRRAANPRAAIEYVRGLTHWLRPIDEKLAESWSRRLTMLSVKVNSEMT
jgi:hypothetical protein